MNGKDIKIIVAVHKQYRITNDPMYLPLQVGRALHPQLPYQGDHTGQNISEKNPYFCELTGLYWAWKNLASDYIGLCHYRRYFSGSIWALQDPWKRVLSFRKASGLLQEAPILLPRKRNYFIETNYSQYVHAHHKQDLTETRKIIQEKYPGYLPAYDAVMERTSGHRFNMFVMRRDLLNDYCTWLFDILFELERRLDISSYTAYDQRVFGFVAERLLDSWLETNACHYKELPIVNMESQHWLKKGFRFLRRKFKGNAE